MKYDTYTKVLSHIDTFDEYLLHKNNINDVSDFKNVITCDKFIKFKLNPKLRIKTCEFQLGNEECIHRLKVYCSLPNTIHLCVNLKRLTLYEVEHVDYTLLSTLKKLTTLRIIGCGVDDVKGSELLENLDTLFIHECGTEPRNIDSILKCEKLTTLGFRNSSINTTFINKVIKDMKITTLYLHDLEIDRVVFCNDTITHLSMKYFNDLNHLDYTCDIDLFDFSLLSRLEKLTLDVIQNIVTTSEKLHNIKCVEFNREARIIIDTYNTLIRCGAKIITLKEN